MLHIYPIPRQLTTSPYLDQLYAPFAAWPEFNLERVPFKQAIRALLMRRTARIAHWHFFDELTQHPQHWQTMIRSLSFMALLKLLRWRGVRLVWTAHNIEPHELRYPMWAERTYRAILRDADAVIAHSQAAADLLSQRYQASTPIHVIPHGAYVGLYGPRQAKNLSRQRLNLPADQFVALNLGTLRPYKGLELLFEAWNGINGRLVIAGGVKDQAYAQALREQAKNQATIDVRLAFIPDADLPTWFGAADVVVLPYRKLLTSGILLWALSYGVPVIAPDLPPVRELIQEGFNGFLFDVGNVRALHSALQRAAQHPNLAQLGEHAYQTALPFDWQSIAERTAEVYRDVGIRD